MTLKLPLAQLPFGEMPFPCSECDAKCCKFYTVTLTAFDLARLVDFRKSLDFVTCKPAKEVRSTMDHPFFLTKDGRLGEYFLCLRRDSGETCSLYAGNHLCSAHPARPLVCRIYPFAERKDGAVGYKKRHRCPVDWEMDEKLVAQVRGDLAQQERELFEYGKICREWNAKHSKTGSFADFVKFCYRKGKETSAAKTL